MDDYVYRMCIMEERNMMKRIDVTVSEVHIKKLKQLTKKGGMNVSEVIRRAIDLYYDEAKKKGGV